MTVVAADHVASHRATLSPLIEDVRAHFATAPVPFPISRAAFLGALATLEQTRPALPGATPADLARAADGLTATTAGDHPDLSNDVLQLIWAYVARVAWAPRTIAPDHVVALEAAGLTGREVAAIAQWTAVYSLLFRRDAGVAAIVAWQASTGNVANPALLDLTDAPSDSAIAEFDAAYQARIGAWHPWVSYAEDGYDWKGNFDSTRAQRKTYRVTASDRELAKILAKVEDHIFDPARAPATDGLSRSGRELAALITSVENGCGYCTTAHAKGYVGFGGAPRDTIAIVDTGDVTALSGLPHLIAEAASILNLQPSTFDRDVIARMHASGVGALAILDLIHATAYFNFANRVIIAIGGYRIE